jgi:hypothetical protein
MLETGNLLRRGGTAHSGAGAKNIGMAYSAEVASATKAGMEAWVLEKWDYVVMAKNIPTYELKVSIREKISSKINIPLFHHSIIPCVRQKEHASINHFNFPVLAG